MLSVCWWTWFLLEMPLLWHATIYRKFKTCSFSVFLIISPDPYLFFLSHILIPPHILDVRFYSLARRDQKEHCACTLNFTCGDQRTDYSDRLRGLLQKGRDFLASIYPIWFPTLHSGGISCLLHTCWVLVKSGALSAEVFLMEMNRLISLQLSGSG